MATFNKKNEIAKASSFTPHKLKARDRKVLETAEQYSPENPAVWNGQAPDSLEEAIETLASTNTINQTLRFVYDAGQDGLNKAFLTVPAGSTIVSFVEAITMPLDQQPTLHIGGDAYSLNQVVGSTKTDTMQLTLAAAPISISFSTQPTTGRILIYLQILAGT